MMMMVVVALAPGLLTIYDNGARNVLVEILPPSSVPLFFYRDGDGEPWLMDGWRGTVEQGPCHRYLYGFGC